MLSIIDYCLTHQKLKLTQSQKKTKINIFLKCLSGGINGVE